MFDFNEMIKEKYRVDSVVSFTKSTKRRIC